MLPFGLVGFVLARRVPGNPIGWILLILAVAMMLSTDDGFYAVRAFRLGHQGLPLARLAVFLAAGWVLMIVLMPLPIALFPDGQRPSGRWRWTMAAYLALGTIFVVMAGWSQASGVLARHIQVDSSGNLVTHSSGGANTAGNVLLVLYVCLSLAWVARQVLSWRGSTGERRQQLKWLLSGGAICIAGSRSGLR